MFLILRYPEPEPEQDKDQDGSECQAATDEASPAPSKDTLERDTSEQETAL